MRNTRIKRVEWQRVRKCHRYPFRALDIHSPRYSFPRQHPPPGILHRTRTTVVVNCREFMSIYKQEEVGCHRNKPLFGYVIVARVPGRSGRWRRKTTTTLPMSQKKTTMEGHCLLQNHCQQPKRKNGILVSCDCSLPVFRLISPLAAAISYIPAVVPHWLPPSLNQELLQRRRRTNRSNLGAEAVEAGITG